MQKVRRFFIQRLIVCIGFLDSFSHPITKWISFHAFPSQYLFTIGQKMYKGLEGGSPNPST